jgi:HEAT repeat protein
MTSSSDSLKTAEELFLESFEGEYEDELPWDAVRALRRGAENEVFQLAASYARSEVPLHRARALDVLAQLGAGKPLSERRHIHECVSIAIDRLIDGDPLVVRSAAWALAHLNGEQAISALVAVKTHADPCVRLAVASGLAPSGQPDAIGALIELMEDSDDEVRNWATFGLGLAFGGETEQLGSLDSDEIRQALQRRLSDPFADVRDEAIWGLARRKDAVGLRLLLGRLDSERCIAEDEMVAADILGLTSHASVDVLRNGLRDLASRR